MKITPDRSGRASRLGAVAIEMLVAASVLGMLIALMLPALERIRSADQSLERRAFALREARNLVEQMQHDRLTTSPELTMSVTEFLPQVQVQVTSDPIVDDSGIPMSRWTLTLSWSEPAGRRSVLLNWWSLTDSAPGQENL